MAEPAVRPRGTSWISVLGGWIASVGMAVLLAPAVAAVVTSRSASPNDLSVAVPVIAGVMGAYLVGGYVSGRMAGYSTSWHGLITSFFGLLVLLVGFLVGAAAERGLLAALGIAFSLASQFPGQIPIGDAFTFAAILGFLGTIFAGWLGGLLAPDHRAAVVQTVAPAPREPARAQETERIVTRDRPTAATLPAFGSKGGDRSERRDRILGADETKEMHPDRS